nr:MAG: PAS domain-containing protein [Leptolyngbya sp. IPPAS B-1204]
MSRIPLLHQYVEAACKRLFDLYQSASTSSTLLPDLLPIALKEIGIVCEELQIALKELNQQTQKISDTQTEVQAERRRYQHLFQLSPDAYLILDQEGNIQEINRATATLLNLPQSFLVGKSFFCLVANEDRALLKEKLAQLAHQPCVELSLSVSRYPTAFFDAELTVTGVTESSDGSYICCILRDITAQKRATVALEDYIHDPSHSHSLYHYSRGEIIALEPQTLWFVAQGAVKLTTLSERGEEILVGIAGKSTVFGSNLTALPTYQATALSRVKLAAISLPEISQSVQLLQTVLTAISQRLRQTESFLAIHGQMRVEDRFKQLLFLLQQTFGQPTEKGTRLEIRLTHQDFASACCTTRVTITRLITKLQQEGKLEIDSHNHLIVKEALFQKDKQRSA